MGVSLRTVQDWEQGRRKPSGSAKALLRIAEQKPEVFMHIL
jgi:putative transcriptional regulator